MNTNTAAKLISRYVIKGGNETTGHTLLADILKSHTGDNLASALVYNGFATVTGATRAMMEVSA